MMEVGLRLDELALELGVHNRSIAKELKRTGIQISSYRDILGEQMVQKMRLRFAAQPEPTPAPPPEVTVDVSEPTLEEPAPARAINLPDDPASIVDALANQTAPRVPAVAKPTAPTILLQGDGFDYSKLLTELKDSKRNDRPAIIDIKNIPRQWPNWIVPISSLIQHFRAQGVRVSVINESSGIQKTNLRNPIEATEANLDLHGVQNIVWVYFDETEAHVLTKALMALIQRCVDLGEGVQQSLNFCLYEILDNVFQHSKAGCGYLMANLVSQESRLSLTIVDTGIGVYNSFRPSKYHPASHFDALTLAIQEGITSTGDRRGNGLFALQRTVQQNQGRLELRSGYGNLLIDVHGANGKDRLSKPVIDDEHHGLVVDWQIDLKHQVSLDEALSMTMVNEQLEVFENDNGAHVVKISNHDAGTGSRRAAEELRHYIKNILSLGAGRLVLDFDGVEVVSASFADEVIGKLVEELGPIAFFNRYSIVGTTRSIQGLLDRAMRLRLSTDAPEAITRSRPRK